MKKLFVAILALGALASCQKEDVPTVEAGMNKTIEINILNITEGTRSLANPTVGGDTEQGTPALCAEFSELQVLFADGGGNVLFQFPLLPEGDTTVGNDHNNGSTDTNLGGSWTEDEENKIIVDNSEVVNKGTRRWHNVPDTVKQIAVVRYEEGDFTYAEDKTNLVGLNLTTIENASKNQALNIERPVTEMVLYGADTLVDTGETHVVNGSVFHVWKAEVNVTPAFARFEVRSIKCTDLGDANMDYYEGTTTLDPTTYGFDELLLKSLTLTYDNQKYTAPGFGSQRLLGSYVSTKATTYDPITEGERIEEYKPEKGAWSWNLTPDKNFNNLKLDIDAYAYDYDIDLGGADARNFPLNVVGLATKEGVADTSVFEAGNIYYIDLVFTEKNISNNESICVDVVVTVNAWNVVDRYPIYDKQ